ncbi:MAG: hypothetical protein K2G13_06580, partial [Muribaculaceae bacterium]|nr:hypothetical protein [Muribaculaceae bacterium]
HRVTKKILMDKALKKNGVNSVPWSSLYRLSTTVEYKSVSGEPVDPVILKVLNVMAQTEHLRWNASHEILGYVYDKDGKDEIRLCHNCLTDWENLDEETRSYDNNVVDITFGIIGPDNKIKSHDLK